MAPQVRLHQLQHLAGALLQVHGTRLQVAGPDEAADASGDPGEATGVDNDLFEQLEALGGVQTPCDGAPPGRLGTGEDGREGLVQLVGEGGRHQAEATLTIQVGQLVAEGLPLLQAGLAGGGFLPLADRSLEGEADEAHVARQFGQQAHDVRESGTVPGAGRGAPPGQQQLHQDIEHAGRQQQVRPGDGHGPLALLLAGDAPGPAHYLQQEDKRNERDEGQAQGEMPLQLARELIDQQVAQGGHGQPAEPPRHHLIQAQRLDDTQRAREIQEVDPVGEDPARQDPTERGQEQASGAQQAAQTPERHNRRAQPRQDHPREKGQEQVDQPQQQKAGRELWPDHRPPPGTWIRKTAGALEVPGVSMGTLWRTIPTIVTSPSAGGLPRKPRQFPAPSQQDVARVQDLPRGRIASLPLSPQGRAPQGSPIGLFARHLPRGQLRPASSRN